MPGKKRVMIMITNVRVSPDGRYLAYVVDSKKQEFLAGPKEQLFVRDLTSGREWKFATFMFISNLIWSPDGERLYFAGGGYETNGAIRVVDVAGALTP
jgi:Tol biopolymer transport system component